MRVSSRVRQEVRHEIINYSTHGDTYSGRSKDLHFCVTCEAMFTMDADYTNSGHWIGWLLHK